MAPSLVTALVAAYLVRRWAPRWGLIDKPGARKVHVTPTPLGGGLAIWLAVVLPFAVGQVLLWLVASGVVAREWLPDCASLHVGGLLQQSPRLWILLGAGTVLMALGLADDRWGLGWKIRLAVQFGVAAACVSLQDWRLTAFIHLPAGDLAAVGPVDRGPDQFL